MQATALQYITGLRVSDAFGQQTATVDDVPTEWTVRELIEGLLGDMRLPRHDGDGRDIVYHARLDREGRNLHGAERVGDVIESFDEIQLTPNIEAGLA